MSKSFEEKAIQTAYMWTRNNYYGSESKAIRSLLNRKGNKGFSEEDAKSNIQLGVKILDHTYKLINEEKQKLEKGSLSHFSNAEIDHSTTRMREELLDVYPNSKVMVEYAISMLVIMPFLR